MHTKNINPSSVRPAVRGFRNPTMPTEAKPAKCPWSKSHMQSVVKRAIDNVGGARGFSFMSRGMQEAIIDQVCWHVVRDGMQFAAPGKGPTFDELVATSRMAYEIAGIWNTED